MQPIAPRTFLDHLVQARAKSLLANLKIVAVLAVFGRVVVAFAGAGEVSDAGDSSAAFAASTIAGTALTGLVLAFFGYALEVLIDIWENTRTSRSPAEEH